MRNKLEMESERENERKKENAKKVKWQAVISCNKLWLPCIHSTYTCLVNGFQRLRI